MKKMDLGGKWDLEFIDEYGNNRVIKAEVPGEVHLDLLGGEIISDPLYSMNSREQEWIEHREFKYSKNIIIDDYSDHGRYEICFGGLDGNAVIYVNGKEAGSWKNAFIPCVIDVTGLLRQGENLLTVVIDSGIDSINKEALEKFKTHEFLPSDDVRRVALRKPQYTFYWDWAPRLINCGICRPVELRLYEDVAIRDMHFQSSLKKENSLAEISFEAEIESFSHNCEVYEFKVELTAEKSHVFVSDIKIKEGLNRVSGTIDIKAPLLWWPNGSGKQNLYDYQVSISKGGLTKEKTRGKYGIKTVSIVKDPLGEEGISFTFEINGRKVFSKGVDWCPLDSIYARVDEEKYRKALKMVKEANFNMIRVWGGSFYETACFYDLCDEYGIMVWQDFMFACAFYPDTEEFIKMVTKETETAVRMLRNHPSIVLWCGNNEINWIHYQGRDIVQRPLIGEELYSGILKELCGRLSPQIPYHVSSPYGGEDPNSQLEGDSHFWLVSLKAQTPEERCDFRNYSLDRCKFVSEFGIFSPVYRETYEKAMDNKDMRMDSEVWKHHTCYYERGAIAAGIKKFLLGREASTLDEYIFYGLIYQAEGIRYAYEHYRRRKYLCSGCLYWSFGDSWVTMGLSMVDYYLNPKPSYYYVKDACKPVIVSACSDGQSADVYVVNDLYMELDCSLEYGIMGLDGTKYDKTVKSIRVGEDSSRIYATYKYDMPDERMKSRSLFYAILRNSGGDIIDSSILTFEAYKDMELPTAELDTAVSRSDGDDAWNLKIRSDTFAWCVCIRGGDGMEVDDNYFNLLPGIEKEIRIRGTKDGITIKAINSDTVTIHRDDVYNAYKGRLKE